MNANPQSSSVQVQTSNHSQRIVSKLSTELKTNGAVSIGAMRLLLGLGVCLLFADDGL